MGKTSIAKKTRDSKHKRGFNTRAKGRQDKKNRQLTQAQNMYVDKLSQLKEEMEKRGEKSQKIMKDEEPEEVDEDQEVEVEMSEGEQSEGEQSQKSQEEMEAEQEQQLEEDEAFDLSAYLSADDLARAKSQAAEATVKSLKQMAEMVKEQGDVLKLTQLLTVCYLSDISVVNAFFAKKDITGAVVRHSNMGLKQFEHAQSQLALKPKVEGLPPIEIIKVTGHLSKQ